MGKVTFRNGRVYAALLAALCAGIGGTAHGQGLVRVTPLGSHDGELCSDDRAMIFEDPTGVRLLYDPGRRVDESKAW
jgi:hypothetical protein